MKNEDKRNHHQLAAWNRKAGTHDDQHKKSDTKYNRSKARKEENDAQRAYNLREQH